MLSTWLTIYRCTTMCHYPVHHNSRLWLVCDIVAADNELLLCTCKKIQHFLFWDHSHSDADVSKSWMKLVITDALFVVLKRFCCFINTCADFHWGYGELCHGDGGIFFCIKKWNRQYAHQFRYSSGDDGLIPICRASCIHEDCHEFTASLPVMIH